MIDLYTWTVPNGRKISIALEELGIPYTAHGINLGKGEQKGADYLKVNPNGKVPAIIDHDTGVRMMESGAILLYLAQKTGKLMPTGDKYWEAMEWLMWQMGGLGPALGQVHHFVAYNPGKSSYGEERYTKEARRLWQVLETRLGEVEYVAGDYTVADISIWPWIARYPIQPVEMDDHPNIKRWYHAIAARPAVQRGWDVVGAGRELPLP